MGPLVEHMVLLMHSKLSIEYIVNRKQKLILNNHSVVTQPLLIQKVIGGCHLRLFLLLKTFVKYLHHFFLERNLYELKSLLEFFRLVEKN